MGEGLVRETQSSRALAPCHSKHLSKIVARARNVDQRIRPCLVAYTFGGERLLARQAYTRRGK